MQINSATWWKAIPWSLAACALALMLLGLTAIERGDELAHAGEFFSKQAVWIALAIPAMFLAMAIPYRALRHSSYFILAGSVFLLVVVYAFPAKWGSRRWVPLGVMNFQPSELAKIAFILALARYLMYRENYRRLSGLVVPFLMTLVPMGLILKEPDLGTSLLFVPVLAGMLFAAGARLSHLASIAVFAVVLSPLFWMGMSAEQKSRVTTLFLQHDGGSAPPGDGYHLHQSKQVLALGGAWGSQWDGAQVDDPLAYHLPACRTDFIFCMLGERWGVFGTIGALGLYLYLFGRGLMIAAATREPFGRLVGVGIVSLLATQTIINVGMTVGLLPITGITLPLMSYGGSSLVFTCFALGLVMNIALRPGYEISHDPFKFVDSPRSARSFA